MRALGIGGYVALAIAILVVRRPDAVLHPQFWAEDGKVYYADAYNRGLDALLSSAAGYLVLAPRLVAQVAQPLGLANAPALFNLVGFVIQLAPALFILSSRFERAVPQLWVRALIGTLYLLVPNYELHVAVTNAQWHLALVMCMVVAAEPPRSLAWRCFDLTTIVLGGLSGVLVVVVAPIALVRWAFSHHRWYGVVALAASITALLQLKTVHDTGRAQLPLGAGLRSLVRILADRVIVPGLTGEQNPAIYSDHWWHGLLWATLLVLSTLALAVYAAVRGSPGLRVLLAFWTIGLALSLLNPLIVPNGLQWPAMVSGEGGIRYFLIPTVGFVVLVVWGLSRLPAAPRAVIGVALGAVLVAGTSAHPQYPALLDRNPAAAASTLAAAPVGTVVDIPINPAGWSMSLRRH